MTQARAAVLFTMCCFYCVVHYATRISPMNFSVKPSLYFCYFCGALILILGLWLTPVSASSLVDPRLAQLEFKVSALQNQVRQLQNQLSPGTTAPARRPTTTNEPPASQPPVATGLPDDLPLDQQFDNLATLVIELNQRVMTLENQLTDSVQ